MKIAILSSCSLLIASCLYLSFAQSPQQSSTQTETKNNAQIPTPELPPVTYMDARPEKGFLYPYYIYIPPDLPGEKPAQKDGAPRTLLVLPNNTGKTDDDLAVHDSSAKRLAERFRGLASNLKVIVLVPVFPRPKTDWRVYTRALDRASRPITFDTELQSFGFAPKSVKFDSMTRNDSRGASHPYY